ncbi:MAG: hypothetical protein NC905_02790 [Candidatus Omnitrophica bacterium]|nr:hypothetical protein [Candidatus Omnitrophota bacterium]MCM8777176.1 hypothetical protein [Candidatus Omnitrophota bacterium]
MKINCFVLTLIWISLVLNGLSQEIKLPEERITGEDIRIEKTRLFFLSPPYFNITIPEIPEPIGKSVEAEGITEGKPYEGYVSFTIGSYNTIKNILSYHSITERSEYLFDLETLLSGGYRDNNQRQKMEFNFQSNSSDSKLSLGLSQGSTELPGPEGHPFNIERDFLSFNTGFSFLKIQDLIPSISQRFYRIDNADEINFTTLNLLIDKYPVIFETGIERYDVFDEGFSTTSFYQSIHKKQGRLNIGGTLKVIERYGARFLPSLSYNINEGVTLNLVGIYIIPDIYRDIISDEYKEIIGYNVAPEEEYKISLVLQKKFTDTDLCLDISSSYRDNFYGWKDINGNGLFEPCPQQYWQAGINFEIKHTLTDYIKWFFKGEKRFLSKDIDFYPEEVFDTGLTVNYKKTRGKLWLSYTGERRFSGKELGSTSVINTEIVFTNQKLIEWGIMLYNITDRDNFKVPGYPAEGRNIMLFIRFFF